VLHLFEQDRGSEVATVGEVAVQRCLADAGAARDLIQRGLGTIGE
jgi:hypothetical protein